MSQFGDDKTSGTLFLELSRIKINKKDNIKGFNQIFTTLLNKIHDKPFKTTQIEFYAFALPATHFHVCEKERETNFS